MLKCEAKFGEKVFVQAEGSMEEVVADIGMVIGKINMGLRTQDEMAAKEFQMAMQILMLPNSPVWSMEQNLEEFMGVRIKSKK